MQKKSKNTVLFVILLVSIMMLLVLLLSLDLKLFNESVAKYSDNSQNTHTSDTEEQYYLPVVTTQKVVVSFGAEVTPEMFIQSVESIYDVSYSYEKEPDMEKYGIQDVIVLVTDSEGNSAAVKTHLNILNLKDRLEINLGDKLPVAEDFLAEPGSNIYFSTDISSINTTMAKEYSVDVVVDGDAAQTVLSIDDYKAPEVTIRNVEGWLNRPVNVAEFIETAVDNATVVEFQYETEPDWSLEGEQQVTILAMDENKNTTVCHAVLTLRSDLQAPIVSVSNLDVIVGSVVAYKSAINYYDNASKSEEMTVEIDNSGVNLDEVGVYDVSYTVTDFAGNSTCVVAKVNVLEENPVWNDEEMLLGRAQEILSEILSEEMSDYDKAEAIFQWVNKNIRFINFSEKDNYIRGAYEGMFLQQGDCFVYAATSKYLLSLANVLNIDIKKSSTDPSHYWNLVYIDDGWYHFDACPTREGVAIFLYTDAELEEFSKSRGNTHVYDKSMYPEIK